MNSDLAERVQDAIRVTGYRRDLTASTLRRSDRTSASIGLIVEDVSNSFFAAAYRGVEEVMRGRHVLTIAGSSDGAADREYGLTQAFLDRRVDGLVIAPAAADHSYLARDRAAGVPLVFLDRPPSFIDADAVVSDNSGGAARAVTHLADHGHRRIAFLGDRAEVFTAAERLAGYREALIEIGLPHGEDLAISGLRSSADGERATLELFRRGTPPTALFTAQNDITVGAVRALRRLDLHRNVALVGFDDVELADLVEPGLTVIAQDPFELGRAAGRLLCRRLDGDRSPYRRVVQATHLIVRGSGEIGVSDRDSPR